jgi:hypothetical protein
MRFVMATLEEEVDAAVAANAGIGNPIEHATNAAMKNGI